MKSKLSRSIQLILQWMSLLCVFQTDSTLAVQCKGNQITIVDKNNQFLRCAPCPPCPPGQEYTISCHTTIDAAKIRACINCPRGKYSRNFDINPCKDCRRCSNGHIRRVCTPFRNAKCGKCLPGYYYSEIVMGCIKCGRCCNDGKDQKPSGCSSVGMCKPRANDCPGTVRPSTSRVKGWLQTNTFVNKTKVHSTLKPSGWLTKTFNKFKGNSKAKPSAPSKVKSTRRLLTELPTEQGTTFPGQTTKPPQDQPNVTIVPIAPPVLAQKESPIKVEYTNTYLLVTVSAFAGLIMILIVVVIVLGRKLRRNNRRPVLESHYSRPVEHLPSRLPDDMLLKDFSDQELSACDKVCTELYKTRSGMYDFDRIATKFQLSPQQRQAIKNTRNTPGENPPRQMIDALCCSIPETTVKQFAQKAKEIGRNDIYNILEPFFTTQQQS